MNNPLEETESAAAHDESRLLRFRLIHVIYVVTLLATSLATFGTGGILPGLFASFFWAAIFTSRSRPKAFLEGCVVVLVCCCLFSLVLRAGPRAREAARRMACMNHLRQIGIALHGYHGDFGSFPPVCVRDANGKPMHSWRVLLLPYLEQEQLYDAYDFSEPWDGPHNSKLLNRRPMVYGCPSSSGHLTGHRHVTSYLAVVGPQTVWPADGVTPLGEIRDGASNTLLVIEASVHDEIAWLEPRDLSLDEALDLVADENTSATGNHARETFFYRWFVGRNVVLADGRVSFIPHGVRRDIWSTILNKDDGVPWDDDDFDVEPQLTKQLRVGNCVRLGVFLLIIAFPLPWVWLNPTSGLPKSSPSSANKT